MSPGKDVLAEDFFVNGTTSSGVPAITPALSAARIRAHKELSHLTTGRRSEADPNKPWNVRELLRETLEALTAFGRHADPSNLHRQVSEVIVLLQERAKIA